MLMNPKGYATDRDTLAGQYNKHADDRTVYLNRGRTCSALTIPTLLPPEGHTGSTALPTPYQSLGARGVNVMASKMMLTVFPPNRPFVKIKLSRQVREQLGASIGEAEQAQQEYVQDVMDNLESTGTRPSITSVAKHLLIVGNVLTFDDPHADLRVFPLTQFVCKRTPAGKPTLVIVHELVTMDEVPAKYKQQVMETDDFHQSPDKSVNLHTGVTWDYGTKMVSVRQELNGIHMPERDSNYPLESCPWNPMRMIRVENENYGRSYVEEYIGDLKSYELLRKYVVHGAAAMAKLVFLVAPNGHLRARTFANAQGGDVLEGNENDVKTVKVDKSSDFNFVIQVMDRVEQSLAHAFLLNSAIQRNGERVTAEEIRYMAEELDSQQGGTYSMLSQDFQLPLYRSRVAKMTRAGSLTKLPEKFGKPMVTTGLDAIGRGNDFQALRDFFLFLKEAYGEEAALKIVVAREGADRAATALGINVSGLLKDQDQIDADAELEQQRQIEQSAVAPTINNAGQAAKAAMPAQQ